MIRLLVAILFLSLITGCGSDKTTKPAETISPEQAYINASDCAKQGKWEECKDITKQFVGLSDKKYYYLNKYAVAQIIFSGQGDIQDAKKLLDSIPDDYEWEFQEPVKQFKEMVSTGYKSAKQKEFELPSKISSIAGIGATPEAFSKDFKILKVLDDTITYEGQMIVLYDKKRAYNIYVASKYGRQDVIVKSMIPDDAVFLESVKNETDPTLSQIDNWYYSDALKEVLPESKGRFCVADGRNRTTGRLECTVVSIVDDRNL